MSLGAGIAQPVWRLATGWTVRGSNPGASEIFRTRPDRPWVPLGLLYNVHRVFPGDKAAGEWRLASTPSSVEVKERVELHICSPSDPSWPFLGGTLRLTLPSTVHVLTGLRYSLKARVRVTL